MVLPTVKESNLDYVLNFQRHEWKYFVHNSKIEILIPELLNYMDFDPYNKGGFYKIYSIYYDTEDWQSFHEKLDGIERRKKFRIRTYTNHHDPESTLLLEIKEKNKDIILKRRTTIRYKDIKRLNAGLPGPLNDSVYDEWRYNIIRNSLKPKILVGYKRMAFVPKDHRNLRVTIDKNVSYAMMNGRIMFKAPLVKAFHAKTATILEIKYSDKPPLFIDQLIRRHNLRNEAISKYCDSVVTNYKPFL